MGQGLLVGDMHTRHTQPQPCARAEPTASHPCLTSLHTPGPSAGLIWVLLWMGFAIVMRGAALDEERWNFNLQDCAAGVGRRARGGAAEDGGAGVDCWSTWWVMRLFFQSMGEFYLEEIDTDAELAVGWNGLVVNEGVRA
eukprot:229873-Rhodomonas_salina.2